MITKKPECTQQLYAVYAQVSIIYMNILEYYRILTLSTVSFHQFFYSTTADHFTFEIDKVF